MKYAIITEGVVSDIIELHPLTASEFPCAVAVNSAPVDIGDTYTNGVFYREGERVLSLLEKMEAMKRELDAATAELADADAALHELGVEWEEEEANE